MKFITLMVSLMVISGAAIQAQDNTAEDIFGLQKGMTWEYAVEMDLWVRGETVHREGTLTRQITAVERYQGVNIYTIEITDHPYADYYPYTDTRYVFVRRIHPYRHKWALYEAYTFEQATAFLDNEGEILPALIWPLDAGDWWGNIGSDENPLPGRYNWLAEKENDIETPAGWFDDCYYITMRTNPDHIFQWFCPEIGIVQYEYGHHGTPHDEIWTLTDVYVARDSR